MPTLVRFRPDNKRERQTNREDYWWKIVREDGGRLCIKVDHYIRWINRAQVIDWKFVSWPHLKLETE